MKNYENYSADEFIKQTKYGMILVDKDETKRFVGYISKPEDNDIISLWEELNDTEEFQYDNINDLTLIEAPEYVVEYFKNNL